MTTCRLTWLQAVCTMYRCNDAGSLYSARDGRRSWEAYAIAALAPCIVVAPSGEGGDTYVQKQRRKKKNRPRRSTEGKKNGGRNVSSLSALPRLASPRLAQPRERARTRVGTHHVFFCHRTLIPMRLLRATFGSPVGVAIRDISPSQSIGSRMASHKVRKGGAEGPVSQGFARCVPGAQLPLPIAHAMGHGMGMGWTHGTHPHTHSYIPHPHSKSIAPHSTARTHAHTHTHTTHTLLIALRATVRGVWAQWRRGALKSQCFIILISHPDPLKHPWVFF